MPTFLSSGPMRIVMDPKLFYHLLNLCLCITAWPHGTPGDNCPSAEWSVMCRPCCEYELIQCRCPSKGSKVGYTVPCCRNAVNECDPCIIHPGCSLFENCKTCNNGTWKANDNFFVNGKYCTECRQGWSGGDCRNEHFQDVQYGIKPLDGDKAFLFGNNPPTETCAYSSCGGVVQRAQGHIALESYPTNARCEWMVQVERGSSIELRFTRLSLESDHNCRYDYVEVRDGDDVNSPIIGRFCGDRLPPPVKSSGNRLHILFSSDGYHNFDGFVLTFQESSVSASETPLCPKPERPLNGNLLPVYSLKEKLQSITYQCNSAYTLIGSQRRICLPNGTWSGTAPTCVKGQTARAQCTQPPKLLNGYHRPAADTAGGAETIEFFCKKSYVLSGNHQSFCLFNGSWSSRPPKCVKVPTACREPKVSELVRQTVVKPRRISSYNMDDLLSARFIPLKLDKNSEDEDAASVELPRGFHSVFTSIEYKCAAPLYRNTGSSRRTCLKTGRWSGRHVSCTPVCGKFSSLSTDNLTDAQWPWHAAIYIRSPPDHTPRSHRPSGGTMSVQQGASEESSFWSLACSGALLTQRSVLVAAQCVVDKDKLQTLHPAHVKVVIGMKQQRSKDRLKGPHHLRVSDILVHPNFYSTFDSDVALLKLKDKAKISERVLPICLPKVQGGELTAQQAYTARWILPNDHTHLTRDTPSSQTELAELADVTQCERAFAEGGAISDSTLCVMRKPQKPSSYTACPRVISGITVTPAVPPSTGAVLSGHKESDEASGTSWQLLGLETLSAEGRSCNQQTYTAQTGVTNFLDWIEKNMK